MSGRQQWKKGNRKWIMRGAQVLFLVLLIELVICNISFWISLFYPEEVPITGYQLEGTSTSAVDPEWVVVDGEGFVLRLPSMDQPVKNIHVSISFSEEVVVPYAITMVDYGNEYPYTLPQAYKIPGNEKSSYTNLYPFGNVKDISIAYQVPQGSQFTIGDISLNATVPIDISVMRLLFLIFFVTLFLLLTAWKELWEIGCIQGNKKQGCMTLAVIAVLIVFGYKMVQINPVCIEAPWPHHKQYQELAMALAEGKVWLPMEPSVGVLQAVNPYDTISLQAKGIDYRADYAYYEGRYYVYFGIVPVLLFYLPYFILTGKNFPNYAAVFLFYTGFIVSVFLLYRETVRRFFQKTPYIVYIMVAALTVLGGNYLFVIARPDLYDTPIMAASMFTVGGLYFWMKGKFQQGKSKIICLFVGSLSMALVAGCRPQMLLFSTLAIPLFWEEVIKRRTLFSKQNRKDTAAICLPFVMVALGIMYYNYVRFASPFDFGATYSLTSNDMTNRSFNIEQLLLGVWHFFFQPPLINTEFPFWQGNQIEALSYMGKLTSEYTYGGVLLCNAFLWLLLFVGKAKEILKQKGMFAFFVVLLLIAPILGMVDVSGAGILQRYMVDFIFALWFATVLVVFGIFEKRKERGVSALLMRVLFGICFLQFFYGLGVVLGNGDMSVNVRTSNPSLYYQIRQLFRF